MKSYTKQKDPGSFRAISALKGPGSYTIVFQQAVLWTERLQQRNARLGAGLTGGSVPDAGLHLADVGAAQQQHAQTALADAAADGVGQLTVQHGLVEGQSTAVRLYIFQLPLSASRSYVVHLSELSLSHEVPGSH